MRQPRPGHTTQPMTIGILSPFPPTPCALASSAAALGRALGAEGHTVRIVRVSDGGLEYDGGRQVAGALVPGSPASARRAALVLSEADVAIVQHDLGVFGGRDGEEVLDVLRMVRGPIISVLRTIPVDPAPNLRRILQELARLSTRVVVLSRAARDRIVGRYAVDPMTVVTIPLGALAMTPSISARFRPVPPHPQVLTWGMLWPNKRIERVIDAMATLRDEGHPVHLTIAGMTHPREVRLHGEAYRNALILRARERGVSHLVGFDRSFRGPEHLTAYLSTSAVVVLPYASPEQTVSGALVDSVAAGRPVIATAFPHAVELLSGGAGVLVGHEDQDGLVDAIRMATSDTDRLGAMAAAARRVAPEHDWSSVGAIYADISALAAGRWQPVPA